MTSHQLVSLQTLIHNLQSDLETADHAVEAHHGDADGADAGFHALVHDMRVNQIVIHPPSNPRARAFCGVGQANVTILPEKDYIDRNHDIVDAVDEMIATPKSREEEIRSGTWATIRYTRRVGRKLTIIWPNGDVTVEPARVSSQMEMLS